jgi:hypothetical protein
LTFDQISDNLETESEAKLLKSYILSIKQLEHFHSILDHLDINSNSHFPNPKLMSQGYLNMYSKAQFDCYVRNTISSLRFMLQKPKSLLSGKGALPKKLRHFQSSTFPSTTQLMEVGRANVPVQKLQHQERWKSGNVLQHLHRV